MRLRACILAIAVVTPLRAFAQTPPPAGAAPPPEAAPPPPAVVVTPPRPPPPPPAPVAAAADGARGARRACRRPEVHLGWPRRHVLHVPTSTRATARTRWSAPTASAQFDTNTNSVDARSRDDDAERVDGSGRVPARHRLRRRPARSSTGPTAPRSGRRRRDAGRPGQLHRAAGLRHHRAVPAKPDPRLR